MSDEGASREHDPSETLDKVAEGAAADPRARADGEREGVILLKGLSRAAFEMVPMGYRLRAEGFETVAPSYSSRNQTLEAAGRKTRQAAEGRGWDVVHAVGHSLGGIVASWMLAELPPPEGARWGRVVQLGAPNGGTAVAAMLAKWPFARAFLGPTISQMAEPREDLLAASAHPYVGAISADTGQSPMGALSGMDAPNDGKVSVGSALGRAGHTLLVDWGHAFYPYSAQAAEAAAAFLHDGHFGAVRHLECRD